MNSLQEMLEQVLSEAPYQALAELIKSKLEISGIRPSGKELKQLVAQLIETNGETFHFRAWQWWDRREVTISISDEETAELIQRFEDFLDGGFSELIQSLSDNIAAVLLATLHKKWSREARRQYQEVDGFERRLNIRWGSAIERLLMLLTVSRELGQAANERLREDEDAPQVLVNVLARLHARACQITEEIICLLRSGFADGAMARWRTLHEIASVAFLLAKHGEPLAERYIAHQFVESFRAATEYQECCGRLGYEPMPENEYLAIKADRDESIKRYGSEFGSQYGWVADALGKKQPLLRDIQEAAGIDHLRAHYRMASHNVHANPKGVFFKLGLLGESDILLAGRSNAGLADPGHSGAISLTQITVALCTIKPNLDSIVGLKILQSLTDEVGKLFHGAHERLLSDASSEGS